MKEASGLLRHACLVALVVSANCVLADELHDELHGAMRRIFGDFSSREERRAEFAVYERECLALTARFTAPEQLGRIYDSLATKAGAPVPEKMAEYAEKALEYPLDPERRLQLCIYWGDAIQLSHSGVRGGELAAARREAVMPYLNGLKAAIEYDLPDEAPDIFSSKPLPPGVEFGSEEFFRIERERARLAAQWETLKQQRNLVMLRDTTTNQIVFLYSRFPFATDELRRLAEEVINDEETVNRLVAAVEEKINERVAEVVESEVDSLEDVEDLLDVEMSETEKPEQPIEAEEEPAAIVQGESTPPPTIEGVPPPREIDEARSGIWRVAAIVAALALAAVLYVFLRRRNPRQTDPRSR